MPVLSFGPTVWCRTNPMGLWASFQCVPPHDETNPMGLWANLAGCHWLCQCSALARPFGAERTQWDSGQASPMRSLVTKRSQWGSGQASRSHPPRFARTLDPRCETKRSQWRFGQDRRPCRLLPTQCADRFRRVVQGPIAMLALPRPPRRHPWAHPRGSGPDVGCPGSTRMEVPPAIRMGSDPRSMFRRGR